MVLYEYIGKYLSAEIRLTRECSKYLLLFLTDRQISDMSNTTGDIFGAELLNISV
jgi:hypothetical protein